MTKVLNATAETPALIEAGRRALALFAEAGYARAEPAIVQPSAAFLDLVGEELQARLLTTGEGGDYCLRPEYTIPLCRLHLESPARGRVSEASYFGPVFRSTPAGPQERRQVGLESYGRTDREAADAEILGLALEGARLAGREGLRVRLGDASLLNEVMARLGLSARWSRRLRRALARGGRLADVAAVPPSASPIHGGVLAAIGKADHAGAKSLVADLLAISGIRPIGGRDIGEIAERLLSKAERGVDEPIGAERLKMLEAFLAVRGDPDDATAALRAFAKDASLDLAESLDRLDARIGFIAARGLDVATMVFSTHFLREYDYYSGFLFDAAPAEKAHAVVGGGRYDALARELGAPDDLPAVGAAIWLDLDGETSS